MIDDKFLIFSYSNFLVSLYLGVNRITLSVDHYIINSEIRTLDFSQKFASLKPLYQ